MQRPLRGQIGPSLRLRKGYAGRGRSADWSAPVGEIVVEIELENAADRSLARAGKLREADVRQVTIPAAADTRATILTLPEDIVERLGLRREGSVGVEYADGRRDVLPIAGPVTVRIGDRHAVSDCIVMSRGSDAQIGQIVTRQMDLIPDYANQTLGPRPGSPDRPTTRL